jgi:hypothetical protein
MGGQTNLTFIQSLLPLVWFTSVAAASGICSVVIGKQLPFPALPAKESSVDGAPKS